MDETKPAGDKKETEIPLQPHFERDGTQEPIQGRNRKEKNSRSWYVIALGLGALAFTRKKQKKEPREMKPPTETSKPKKANQSTKHANYRTKNANLLDRSKSFSRQVKDIKPLWLTAIYIFLVLLFHFTFILHVDFIPVNPIFLSYFPLIFFLITFVYLIVMALCKKFCPALALSLFLIAYISVFDIIWVQNELPRDSSGLTLSKTPLGYSIQSNESVSSEFMGVKPPLDGRPELDNFWGTNDASPEEFKTFLNRDSNFRTRSRVSDIVTCRPYPFDLDLFEEGGLIYCDLNFTLPRIPEITARSTKNYSNKEIAYFLRTYAFYNVSICTLQYPTNYTLLSPWGNNQLLGIILAAPHNSGSYNLKIEIWWRSTLKEGNKSSRWDDGRNETEIDTLAVAYNNLITIRSTEEVLDIQNRKTERNYQLLIALFALFGIFTAVYHLKNLWENR